MTRSALLRPAPLDDQQLHFFAPAITDVAPRDARETMEFPFLSLSKRKRVKPIDYTSPSGHRIFIHASPQTGIANIYDWDLPVFGISVIRAAADRGEKVSPTVRFHPGDFLKAVRRPNTSYYQRGILESLRRLKATVIETTIREDHQEGKSKQADGFNWVDHYTVKTRTINTAKGPKEIVEYYEMTFCPWLFNAAFTETLVLSFDPDYFLLDGGYERWLYRLIRKSAGRTSWTWRLAQLYERSGKGEPYKIFAYHIRNIVLRSEKERIFPGYVVSLVMVPGEHGKEEMAVDAKAIETKDARAQIAPGESHSRRKAGAFALDHETEAEGHRMCAEAGQEFKPYYDAWVKSNLKHTKPGSFDPEQGLAGHLTDKGRAFLGYLRICLANAKPAIST